MLRDLREPARLIDVLGQLSDAADEALGELEVTGGPPRPLGVTGGRQHNS